MRTKTQEQKEEKTKEKSQNIPRLNGSFCFPFIDVLIPSFDKC